jgi:nicotinate-nucleotide adenylyltransferase
LKNNPSNKVGLYGGTFDPPHNAHIQLALYVLDRLQLDSLYFIPAAVHALKKNTITPAAIRNAMLQAAISDYSRLRVSTIELKRASVSYSIDTIKQFKQVEQLPLKTKLYYLIGMDNLHELHLWKNPQEIFRLAQVVILRRPGFRKQGLGIRYPQAIFLESPLYPHSATDIRQRIKSGQAVTDLVPPKVWEIIREQRLYSAAGAGQEDS